MTTPNPDLIDVTGHLEAIRAQADGAAESHTQLGVLRAQVASGVDQAIDILQRVKSLNRDKADHAHTAATANLRIRSIAADGLTAKPHEQPKSGINKLPPVLPSFFFITCASICLAMGGTQTKSHGEPSMSKGVREAMIANADMAEVEGRHADALRAYRKIVREHGGEAELLVKIAKAEFGTGHFAIAIFECTRSIDLSENVAEAYMLRGVAKLEMKDKAGAKADLKAASDMGESRATAILASPVFAGGS